jgi:glycerol-3-phosphate acyltransferase PlsY
MCSEYRVRKQAFLLFSEIWGRGGCWAGLRCSGLRMNLGHLFSPFLGFKGGKGVATAVGAVLGLSPSIGLLVLLIWLGTVAIWRYSSAGALAAFSCLPVVAIVNEQRQEFLIFSLIVSGLIWFKHKDNIVRLWKGTESKIGQRKD